MAGFLEMTVGESAHFTDLPENARNKFLTAEARIHAHQKNHVDLIEHVVQAFHRSRGIQYETGLRAGVADQLQRTVNVAARLNVERNPVSTRLRELRYEAVHRLHHQMHVNIRLCIRANCLQHARADREIRYIMVVHHVEVNPVRPGSDDIANLFAKPGKVSGKDRRGDADILHGILQSLVFFSGTYCKRAGRDRSEPERKKDG